MVQHKVVMKETADSSVFTYNGSGMGRNDKTGKIATSQEERFLEAFEEFGDALFRHASLRINDRERAIDVVHDTYTKVWGYVQRGHEIEQFRPFLYKVLNNLIIDEYRKHKESSLDALMEQDGVDDGSFAELSENTVDSLAATIDGRKAFTVLEQLPDVYREVIILRFIDELGPKEISELIEESENVVSVRLHRGLKLLRTTIESEEKAIDEKRAVKNSKTKPKSN
ncbi:sigma-70 family RNA polymerase sigma factor [Candidatus Pacebacteria bacterium]|nr:sigma-70 family RNA polymerase sigma factor [Candidatus Paceibacterota bacterium]